VHVFPSQFWSRLNNQVCARCNAACGVACKVLDATLFLQDEAAEDAAARAYTYANVRNWTAGRANANPVEPPIDIFACSIVLVPVFKNGHISLGAIFPQTREISTPDSLHAGDDFVYEQLLLYVADEHQDKKHVPLPHPHEWRRRLGQWPPQPNGDDCGVCASRSGERLLLELPVEYLCTQAANDKYRISMLLQCLNGIHAGTVAANSLAVALRRPLAPPVRAPAAAAAQAVRAAVPAVHALVAVVAPSTLAPAAAEWLDEPMAPAASAGAPHPVEAPRRSAAAARPVRPPSASARRSFRQPVSLASMSAPARSESAAALRVQAGNPGAARVVGAAQLLGAPSAAALWAVPRPLPPPLPQQPLVFTGRSLRSTQRVRAAEQSARLAAAAVRGGAAALQPLGSAAAPAPPPGNRAAAAAPAPPPGNHAAAAAPAPPPGNRAARRRLWAQHAAHERAAAAPRPAAAAALRDPPAWMFLVRGLKYDRHLGCFLDRDKNSARCMCDLLVWAFVRVDGGAERPPYLEHRDARLEPLPPFVLRLPARAAAAAVRLQLPLAPPSPTL